MVFSTTQLLVLQFAGRKTEMGQKGREWSFWCLGLILPQVRENTKPILEMS